MKCTKNDLQKEYFEKPFSENFFWRTTNPYVSLKETKLLANMAESIKALPIQARILEIGCGEGSNIALLRQLGVRQDIFGIDLSFKRVFFCCQNCKNFIGITMSASDIGFKSETFDFVFFRDLLHHMDGMQKKVLSESLRLLKVGGTLYFIEANGLNPGFFLLAITIKAERGLFRSNPKNIAALASQCGQYELFMYEPSNFFRILFHYSAGLPKLANFKFFAFLADVATAVAQKIVPKNNWAYICVKIIKEKSISLS